MGSGANLLKHIYTAHPPKKSSHVLKPETEGFRPVQAREKSEGARRGVPSYHPDHNARWSQVARLQEIRRK